MIEVLTNNLHDLKVSVIVADGGEPTHPEWDINDPIEYGTCRECERKCLSTTNVCDECLYKILADPE